MYEGLDRVLAKYAVGCLNLKWQSGDVAKVNHQQHTQSPRERQKPALF